MSNYGVETWTIRDVAKAFNYRETSIDENDRKIVVPIFQRGLRWKADRRRAFINSLEQGFPFGSLLFSKQDGLNKYSVVDGLQRGSTVCDYVFNPLAKDNFTSVDDTVLNAIRLSIFPNNSNLSINKKIEECILNYSFDVKTFENFDAADLAEKLYDSFPNNEDYRACTVRIRNAILPFIKSKKQKYEDICSACVPIVVYSGRKELLNEIFQRINKNGIALNDYEIYSATWSQKNFQVNNIEVIEKVIKKYWTLADKGFEVDGFDATKMRTSKQLTIFEFLFGLGKYWSEKFDCLMMESNAKDDDVNEISFELIDACINDSKSVASLDEILKGYNINKLQRRIEEAICYVSNSIKVVSSFKGNKRKFIVLHSKYQILSLIACTFREMYSVDNLDAKKENWHNIENSFSKLLLSHYVADIISNEWHDGGGSKLFTSIREKRYSEEISQKRWESLLDNYFYSQLQNNKQSERFSNPSNADSIILNCVYSKLFTAEDQLSKEKFDIEHLATKEKMRSLIKNFNDLKLPVSCIANYCYLPENINRGKKDKTIYEANDLSLPINVIEEKYSFTKEEDFDWLYSNYTEEQKEILATRYNAFLENRYKIIKDKFLKIFE